MSIHHSYHLPGVTDLDVIRIQARRRAEDKHGPESTILHFHDHGTSCAKFDHEVFEQQLIELTKDEARTLAMVRHITSIKEGDNA